MFSLLSSPAGRRATRVPTTPMWTRKSSDEIANENRVPWRSFGGPAIALVLGFLGSMAIFFQGPRVGPASHWPATLGDATCQSLFAGVIAAIVVFIAQLVYRTRDVSSLGKTPAVICSGCHRTKTRDQQAACACGGQFEPFQHWKWVDDATQELEP